MNLKPLKDYVVASVEKPAEKTSSGLLLPSDSKEKPAFAIVVSTGPDVKTIKKSDKIIYKEYSTTPVKIGQTDYLLIKEEDILATVA